MNGLSSSSPQGGRRQRKPDIAPAPKQLSNGSEARHAPWTAKNEHTMSLQSCSNIAVKYLTFLSNAARQGMADACKAP